MSIEDSEHQPNAIENALSARIVPLLVIIFVFVLGLHGAQRNTIQISLADLRDASPAFLLVLLEHTDLLQRLHDLAVDRARGIDVVRRPRAAVLGAAVDFAHAADADGLAHVDVAGDGSGADVEPEVACVSI